MADRFGTTVTFSLKVQGQEALAELRSVIDQMQAALKTLNDSATNVKGTVASLSSSSATMGAGMGAAAKQADTLTGSLQKLAGATAEFNKASAVSTTSASRIARTSSGVVSGGNDLYGLIAKQEELQRQQDMMTMRNARATGATTVPGGTIIGPDPYGLVGQEEQAKRIQALAEAEQRALNGLGAVRVSGAQQIAHSGVVSGGRDIFGLVPGPAWNPPLSTSGKPMSLMETFAFGAEQKTLEMWGIRRIGFDLQQLGRTTMYSGIAFATAMATMMDSYSEFNYATTRAAATMRLPIELFGELEDSVRAAAIETARFSPTEVAEGLRQWAAGTGEVITSSDQLQGLLQNTVSIQKLAAMNSVELEQTMAGVGGAMAAYGLALDDVTHVASVFNYVAAESFANVDDIGQAFTFVGPLAAEMGISFEETAAALALLSDANIKGSMAGRAFRQMLMSLGDPTSSVSEALDKLLNPMMEVGQTWEDIVWQNGEFVGLPKYVDLLAQSIEGLTEAEQVQALAELATANQLPATITLVRAQAEARKDGINIISAYSKILNNVLDSEVIAYKNWYEKTTGAMFSVEGAMARYNDQWEEYIESPAGQMDRLKQEWRSALLDMSDAITDALLPTLVDLAGALGDVAAFFGEHPWITKAVAGITAINIAGGALITTAGRLVQTWALWQTLDAGTMQVMAAGGWGAGVAAMKAAATKAVLPGTVTTAAVKVAVPVIIMWEILSTDPTGGMKREIDSFAKETQEQINAQKRVIKWPWQIAMDDTTASLQGPMADLADMSSGARREFEKLFYLDTTKVGSPWIARGEQGRKYVEQITGALDGTILRGEDLIGVIGLVEDAFARADNAARSLGTAPDEGLIRYYERLGQAVSVWSGGVTLSERDIEIGDAWVDYKKRQMALEKQYNREEEEINREHVQRLEDINEDYIDTINSLSSEYGRRTARTAEDYAIADQRSWQDYQDTLTKIASDAQEQREKAAEDYYDRLRKLERDHTDKMIDLLEKRDVQGLTKEVRSYRNNLQDLEQDRAKDEATRTADTQKRMDEARIAFEKQQRIEQENRELARKRAEEDYALQLAQAEKNHAEQLAQAEEDHAESLDQLKAQLKEDTDALKADMADKTAELLGVADTLKTKIYPQMVADAKVGWAELEKVWLQGVLDLIGLIEYLRLDVGPVPMEATIPAGGPASEENYGPPRAAGGYVNYGRYLLGEQGKEFVLSAPTTKMMEDRFGYLNQSSFSKMGSTFTFAPVFQGVGRQDMNYIHAEMNRWWIEAQKDLVRLVR